MQYDALIESQIIGRLKVDNPWWFSGGISCYYADMKPRHYLDIFFPLVKDVKLRRAMILISILSL